MYIHVCIHEPHVENKIEREKLELNICLSAVTFLWYHERQVKKKREKKQMEFQ